MAKGKMRFPLDSASGAVTGDDRTIGRSPGNSAAIQTVTKTKTAKGTAVYPVKVIVKKAPTRGGSPARHSRAERYCYCDHGYALLSTEKLAFLEPWWLKVMDGKFVHMSNHSIWMKLCLKYMTEMDVFSRMSYCTRYRVVNDWNTDWTSQPVILTDIPTYQTDGQDVEVYKLLQVSTKKGNIVYDPLMIDTRLVHEVTTRGEAKVWIPSLQQGSSLLVDVYSYYTG